MSASIDLGDGVAVVGAGIGGLVAALSLDAIGVDVTVFEAAPQVRPAGVGINLLPHSIRELDALGLLDRLAEHAIAPGTLVYFAKNGRQIWSEPRGIEAGYAWPQLSIHRGELHRILLEAAAARIGTDRIVLEHRLLAVTSDDRAARATFSGPGGAEVAVQAAAIVAADGIHSVARARFYPDQGPPKWSGALLWRGIVDRAPVLDGRTMVWIGHPAQKFVGYPIADLGDGRQSFNFIAELRPHDATLADREDWNREGDLADFLPAFEDWTFDWLDVPDLIRSAPRTFVFPMVDRDPVDRWTFGRVTLLGDAAHPMYPIGSNGASQAILDARVLAGCVRSHDDIATALERYQAERLAPTSAIVEANRGLGPERPMQLVEERAPDGFEHIDDVISPDEILEITDGYRRTAGFALAALDDPTSLADRSYSARTDTRVEWEANAPAWIEMSRAGADRYRDLVNTPAFLDALPDIDGLKCLDVGCGEGHNTRLLRERGADLVALDIAAAFVTAARDTSRTTGAPIDHVHADATRLPFADRTFDAATAFMSLMDTPDPSSVLRELARVLRPGGWVQFSVTHPTSTTRLRKWIDDEHGVRTWLAIGDYFDEGTRTDTWTFSMASAEMRARHAPFTVTVNRRTLASWFNMVVDAGLTIDHVVEPTASVGIAADHPDVADTRIIPFFLIVRASRR